MNGITIIAEHLCRKVSLPELIITGCFVTLLCAGGLFLFWFTWKKSNIKIEKEKTMYLTFSIVMAVICIVFWCLQIISYNTTHMEYTVTIDDSVSFNEFYAKYEIISVNGYEYRVVEK